MTRTPVEICFRLSAIENVLQTILQELERLSSNSLNDRQVTENLKIIVKSLEQTRGCINERFKNSGPWLSGGTKAVRAKYQSKIVIQGVNGTSALDSSYLVEDSYDVSSALLLPVDNRRTEEDLAESHHRQQQLVLVEYAADIDDTKVNVVLHHQPPISFDDDDGDATDDSKHDVLLRSADMVIDGGGEDDEEEDKMIAEQLQEDELKVECNDDGDEYSPDSKQYSDSCWSPQNLVKKEPRSDDHKNPRKRIVECPVCGKRMTRSSMNKHKKIHLGIKPFSCVICGRAFSRKMNMERHMQIHGPKEKREAQSRSEDPPDSKENILDGGTNKQQLHHHANSSLSKRVKSKVVRNKNKVDYNEEVGDHFDDAPLSPSDHQQQQEDLADFSTATTTTTTSSWSRKKDGEDEGEQFSDWLPPQQQIKEPPRPPEEGGQRRKNVRECETCGKYITSSNFDKHRMLHTGSKPFSCSICGKCFSRKANMWRHMITHHSEEYSAACREDYSSSEPLHSRGMLMDQDESNPTSKDCDGKDIIYRDNSGEKPHLCSECGKSFLKKRNWKAHILTHGPKEIVCGACGKGFLCNKSLEEHLQHSGCEIKVELTCKICGKEFKQESNLRSHMRVHSEEKPYTCEVCGESFRRPYMLNIHKVRHHEKPICDICTKSFTSFSSLNKHQRAVHSDERPFSCDVCGKAYKDKYDLKKHKKVHNKDEHVRCDVCAKSFSLVSDLNKHYQRVHIDKIYSLVK